jgi:hypothetical protein
MVFQSSFMRPTQNSGIKMIGADGKESVIDTLGAFIERIRAGDVTDHTLLQDMSESTWKRAETIEAYRSVRDSLMNQRDTHDVARASPEECRDTPNLMAREGRRRVFVSAVLVFVSLCLLAFTSLYHYACFAEVDVAEQIGYMGTYALLISLIAAVLRRLYWAREERGAWLLVFSILFLITSVYRCGTQLNELHDLKIAKACIQELMDDAIALRRPASSVDVDTFGKFKPVIVYFRRCIEDSLKLRESMLADVAKIGFEDHPLNAEHLSQLAAIAAEEVKLDNYESTLDKYERSSLELEENMLKDLKALDIPDSWKPEMLSKFGASQASAKDSIRRKFAFPRRALAEIRTLLAFAKSKYGTYSFDNGGISFQSAEDRDFWNAHIRELQAIEGQGATFQDVVKENLLQERNSFSAGK